jgi:hypothetical protein
MVCDMEKNQDRHADGANNHRDLDPADGAVRHTHAFKNIQLAKDQM